MADAPVRARDPRYQVTAHLDNFKTKLGGPFHSLPRKSAVSVLMKHGGFQILTKSGAVLTRLRKHLPDESEDALAQAATAITGKAEMFFQKLSERCYRIPSELMSHLTFPHEGRTYSEAAEAEAENPTIPAVFTFIGQFVDHDLTFNGANLFNDQTGSEVPNLASPLIDLDSVYGGRTYPDDPSDGSLKGIIKDADVFNSDMSFKLKRFAPNAYDVRRFEDPASPARLGAAYIFDPRNDENQLILHVHMLVMRLHNTVLGNIYRQGVTHAGAGKAACNPRQKCSPIGRVCC